MLVAGWVLLCRAPRKGAPATIATMTTSYKAVSPRTRCAIAGANQHEELEDHHGEAEDGVRPCYGRGIADVPDVCVAGPMTLSVVGGRYASLLSLRYRPLAGVCSSPALIFEVHDRRQVLHPGGADPDVQQPAFSFLPAGGRYLYPGALARAPGSGPTQVPASWQGPFPGPREKGLHHEVCGVALSEFLAKLPGPT